MTATTDIGSRERELVDFLNTLDVEEGTDALAHDPEARDIRDALRALVSGANVALPTVALRVRTTDGGNGPGSVQPPLGDIEGHRHGQPGPAGRLSGPSGNRRESTPS